MGSFSLDVEVLEVIEREHLFHDSTDNRSRCQMVLAGNLHAENLAHGSDGRGPARTGFLVLFP